MNAHIELINTRHHNIDRLSSCFALNVDSQIMHVPHKYSVCVCARARFFFLFVIFFFCFYYLSLSISVTVLQPTAFLHSCFV